MSIDRTRAGIAAAGSLMLALTACSGASSNAVPGESPAVPAALQRVTPNRAGHAASSLRGPAQGWLSPQAASGKNLVYVASDDGSNGAVYVYPTKGQAQKPIGAIVNGVSLPAGIAVDSGGNLYVTNTGTNTVTMYPPGQTSASVTYSNGVATPQDVTVGSDGTVYVANETGSPSGAGSIAEYPSGSTTPNRTLTLAGEYAFAAALDASNNLYVSWFSLSSFAVEIYKYAPGSSTGTNLGLDLPSYVFPVFDLAFDHSGNLVLAVESLDHNPPKAIEMFPPGATEPSRTIDEGGLVDVVEGIAFPKNPRIFYVASANDHDWMKLTYRKGIPRDVVNVGVPAGLALSPGT